MGTLLKKVTEMKSENLLENFVGNEKTLVSDIPY